MFKCAVTGRVSKIGERGIKVVIAERVKEYTTLVRNVETGRVEGKNVSKGKEIVKEILVTEAGCKILEERLGKKIER